MSSFTIRIAFANGGSFTAGTVVDHLVVTVTGPSNPPVQTVGANVQYVTFGPGMNAGGYSYSIQAQDINNVNLGPAANGTFSYTPTPATVLPLPQSARIVSST